MKLVECPVVDNTPFLSAVLYIGHSYIGLSRNLACLTGFNQMIGTLLNNTLGCDSLRHPY